mmetsp:Transcript_97101/g.274479  ORF Transcript_97101/g.274479 Transcript_97101/m.274479 type:complete len:221 (-) Transcript_97101:254-916(-)
MSTKLLRRSVSCFFVEESSIAYRRDSSFAHVRDCAKKPLSTSSRTRASMYATRSVASAKMAKEPRHPPIAVLCDVVPASMRPQMCPAAPQAMRKPNARPRSLGGQTAPMRPWESGPSPAPTMPARDLTIMRVPMRSTKAVANVNSPQQTIAYWRSVSLQWRSAKMPHTSTAILWHSASASRMLPKDTGVAPRNFSSMALNTPGSIAPSAAYTRKTTAMTH